MAAASSLPNRYGSLITCGTVILVVAALYLARAILIPVVLAILFALVFSPVVVALQRRGLGRVPSVILVVLLALCIMGGVSVVVVSQVKSLAADLPRHKEEIITKIASVRDVGKDTWLGSVHDTVK